MKRKRKPWLWAGGLITTTLALLLTATNVLADTTLTFNQIVGRGDQCYISDHGIEVLTLNRRCPHRSLIEHETMRFLNRMSAPQYALDGVTITLSPLMLNSIPGGNVGEMEPGTSRAVVMLMPTFERFMEIWCHELTHILLDRVGADVGALHAAYEDASCIFDPDACELLGAAGNIQEENGLLNTHNEYRIKFSNLTPKAMIEIRDKHIAAR